MNRIRHIFSSALRCIPLMLAASLAACTAITDDVPTDETATVSLSITARQESDLNTRASYEVGQDHEFIHSLYVYIVAADGTVKKIDKKVFEEEEYVVNFGPQHPSTHGVMRLRASIDGETILKVDPMCGYIHRGIEKLCESKTYPQTLMFTDRMDYMSAHQNRHCLCLCIEKAMGVEVSDRVKCIRTIMDELQRMNVKKYLTYLKRLVARACRFITM